MGFFLNDSANFTILDIFTGKVAWLLHNVILAKIDLIELVIIQKKLYFYKHYDINPSFKMNMKNLF